MEPPTTLEPPSRRPHFDDSDFRMWFPLDLVQTRGKENKAFCVCCEGVAVTTIGAHENKVTRKHMRQHIQTKRHKKNANIFSLRASLLVGAPTGITGLGKQLQPVLSGAIGGSVHTGAHSSAPDVMGGLNDIPLDEVRPPAPARESDGSSSDGEQSRHDAMQLEAMLHLQDQCNQDFGNQNSLARIAMMQHEVEEDEWGLELEYHSRLARMNWDLEQEHRAERLASYIKDVEVPYNIHQEVNGPTSGEE